MKMEIELPPSLQELFPSDWGPSEPEKKIFVLLSKAYAVNPVAVDHLIDSMDHRSLLAEDRSLLDQLTTAAREIDRAAGGSDWVEAVAALKARLGA